MTQSLLLLLTLLVSQVAVGAPSNINPSLPRLDGSAAVTNADFTGKTTLVQFWASWCKTCSGEVAKSAALARESGAEFLAISEDEDMASARSALKKVDGPLKALLEKSGLDADAAFARTLGVESVPATALVGPDGKSILSFKGHADAAQVKKLQELIAAAKGTKAAKP